MCAAHQHLRGNVHVSTTLAKNRKHYVIETGYQRWSPAILLPVRALSCSQPPPLLYQGLVLTTNRIWQRWWYGAPPDSFIKKLCSFSLVLSLSLPLSLSLSLSSLCLLLPTTMWVNLDVNLLETSLVVQWLRLCLLMQGMRVQNLVGELRCHMPQGQKAKT